MQALYYTMVITNNGGSGNQKSIPMYTEGLGKHFSQFKKQKERDDTKNAKEIRMF